MAAHMRRVIVVLVLSAVIVLLAAMSDTMLGDRPAGAAIDRAPAAAQFTTLPASFYLARGSKPCGTLRHQLICAGPTVDNQVTR
jgi:hypothetical protein